MNSLSNRRPISYDYTDFEGLWQKAFYPIPCILDVFFNPLKGFAGYTSSKIINGGTKPFIQVVTSLSIFLLIMSIMIHFVTETKAFEAGISIITKKLKNKVLILIPILMVILSVCGTTFGMCGAAVPL